MAKPERSGGQRGSGSLTPEFPGCQTEKQPSTRVTRVFPHIHICSRLRRVSLTKHGESSLKDKFPPARLRGWRAKTRIRRVNVLCELLLIRLDSPTAPTVDVCGASGQRAWLCRCLSWTGVYVVRPFNHTLAECQKNKHTSCVLVCPGTVSAPAGSEATCSPKIFPSFHPAFFF